MRKAVSLLVFNACFPLFVVAAAPAWIMRMARRGGLTSRLWERLTIYDREAEFEKAGAVYLHAVSVGEMVMALKLVDCWRRVDPGRHFILSATTSTGYDLAVARAGDGVRVIFSPLDVPFLVRRMLRRFEPSLVALIDSELWPNLLDQCHRKGIPLGLANARLSPRSERRHRRFNNLTRPYLEMFRFLGAQADDHARTWRDLGVPDSAVAVTGSLKFDPAGQSEPALRAEFSSMLDAFGTGRPVVLLASSHAGEEAWVAEALAGLPECLLVFVPRHAERRDEVVSELEAVGCEGMLRTRFAAPGGPGRAALVVDTTGELRDWTAHADLVLIGKSILGEGGQNPSEAVIAGKPVLTGPHMGNFEPLISELRAAGGVATIQGPKDLAREVSALLADPARRSRMITAARRVLAAHEGACHRTVERLRELAKG